MTLISWSHWLWGNRRKIPATKGKTDRYARRQPFQWLGPPRHWLPHHNDLFRCECGGGSLDVRTGVSQGSTKNPQARHWLCYAASGGLSGSSEAVL